MLVLILHATIPGAFAGYEDLGEYGGRNGERNGSKGSKGKTCSRRDPKGLILNPRLQQYTEGCCPYKEPSADAMMDDDNKGGFLLGGSLNAALFHLFGRTANCLNYNGENGAVYLVEGAEELDNDNQCKKMHSKGDDPFAKIAVIDDDDSDDNDDGNDEQITNVEVYYETSTSESIINFKKVDWDGGNNKAEAQIVLYHETGCIEMRWGDVKNFNNNIEILSGIDFRAENGNDFPVIEESYYPNLGAPFVNGRATAFPSKKCYIWCPW